MKKLKAIAFIFLSLFISGELAFILSHSKILEQSIEIKIPQVKNPKSSFEKKDSVISIVLVGDVMLSRGVEYMMKKYNNFKWPFLKIAQELKKANIVFGNLEGPISDKGSKAGSIYSFRANPKTIEGLKFAGFNVLSLANNHALDYTREALKDTLLRLKENNISYVGAGFNEKEAFSVLMKEIQGTKIGFLAYTNLGPETWRAKNENPGISWISENDFEKIKQDIRKAKETVDILIVSLHAGEEYKKEPTPFQISFSKMAIEAGADVVIEHHPHVVQKNEKYLNGWIFYSLGNFIFDQGFSKETMEGEIVKIVVKDKRIEKVLPLRIKINQFFQPEFVVQ